ncbi:MAG: Rpn family recombination-promoting nuclease/putative transposase, partial [Gammaproteobacteria bacterium]|nr:Rpn family recombination-promoting nuclease/putative transposase [Gammaproteobacteria bacterium]
MTNDQAFKDIFGYPAVVRGLLHWFAARLHGLTELVDGLDLSRLERRNEQTMLPGTGGAMMGQASDIVWHAPFAGIVEADRKPWQELVMPWEFQTEPNYLMPLRTRAYVDGQHLERLKRRRLASTERLAPVLPVVVYTGEATWPVPSRVEHMLPSLPGMPRPSAPEPTTAGRALLSGDGYLTLDIAALRPDDFDDGNVMSLLARLTHPRLGEATA